MDASGMVAQEGWGSAVGRGVVLFAGLGGVLDGVATTSYWPVVATFFGVLEGALTGAAFGVCAGVTLGWLSRVTRSLWLARMTSGVAAGAVAVIADALYPGPTDLAGPIGGVFLAAATLAGALFGPLIAYGMEYTPSVGEPRRLAATLHRFLGWGAVVGAGAGAVVGLIIGLATYVPTCVFAAAEGATLGTVSGLMLSCLAVAVALGPRMRARR